MRKDICHFKKEDEYGTVSDKIRKLFTFRIPYYVGPLNGHSPLPGQSEKMEMDTFIRGILKGKLI